MTTVSGRTNSGTGTKLNYGLYIHVLNKDNFLRCVSRFKYCHFAHHNFLLSGYKTLTVNEASDHEALSNGKALLVSWITLTPLIDWFSAIGWTQKSCAYGFFTAQIMCSLWVNRQKCLQLTLSLIKFHAVLSKATLECNVWLAQRLML